ncbi:MAG: nitrous oxide reductase accessory protein NosL [Caldimicrobium sp.]|nr:nitrous oxide reductase accessory protein NosL [Caldimicrobium sp.]
MVSLILFVLLLFGGFALLQAVDDDIVKHPTCKYCQMDRKAFNFSRMLVVYDDGHEEGVCSLHCAALDMAINIDKAPVKILVADYNTKKLIDAERAYWVIGGSIKGVMTKRAKWAFEKKEDALAFIQRNGGKLGNFEEAIKAAYEDMYEDTKMIRERRKMKRMQKGGN